jgi:hypothetical protein
MKPVKLFEQYIAEKVSSKKIVTVSDFFDAIKNTPEIEEYKNFMKETGISTTPYISMAFHDNEQHYPAYPLIPFKYFNVKGYLTPLYWGSNSSSNIATRLLGADQILNGYVIFGENMGSKDMGSYGTGEAFIRPYGGKSRDNDPHSNWQYVVSLSTAAKYLDEKYWTRVESSLAFYEYLTLDPKAVSVLKRESKSVLANFYDNVINKINVDPQFLEWKNGSKPSVAAKDAVKDTETLEDKLKALETADFQNRKGNYPKDGIADSISYYNMGLQFEFKNTDNRNAERWVKNFLSGKNLSPKKIKAEQTGDYQDDWVTVIATFK